MIIRLDKIQVYIVIDNWKIRKHISNMYFEMVDLMMFVDYGVEEKNVNVKIDDLFFDVELIL